MEAEIKISYKSVGEANAVAGAVAPDNIKAPKGLVVNTKVHVTEVSTRIICQTRFETFIATIDDLLSAISVAENSLSAVKKH